MIGCPTTAVVGEKSLYLLALLSGQLRQNSRSKRLNSHRDHQPYRESQPQCLGYHLKKAACATATQISG